jgi:hypothetical protein
MAHTNDVAPEGAPGRRRRLLAGRSPRTRSVVVATGLLVVGISPFAVARTGDVLREGVRNGTTTQETEVVSRVGSTNGPKGGYSTRQSNLSSTGGGAVYGCRSGAGGSAATPTPQNPCVRANNLSSGFAFEFNASNGNVVGLITAGRGGDDKRPFTTNATGVATGLNADRVDGLDATELTRAAVTATRALSPFAQVTAAGAAGQTRGVAANGVARTAAGVFTVVFTGDLGACVVSATITGTDFGEITATPAVAGGNTTVTVRTANSAGVPADRPFHLSANC